MTYSIYSYQTTRTAKRPAAQKKTIVDIENVCTWKQLAWLYQTNTDLIPPI